VILQFSVSYKFIQKATQQHIVFQFFTVALLSVILVLQIPFPDISVSAIFQSWNLAVTEFCGTKRCKFL